jgi:hypothetical protein
LVPFSETIRAAIRVMRARQLLHIGEAQATGAVFVAPVRGASVLLAFLSCARRSKNRRHDAGAANRTPVPGIYFVGA